MIHSVWVDAACIGRVTAAEHRDMITSGVGRRAAEAMCPGIERPRMRLPARGEGPEAEPVQVPFVVEVHRRKFAVACPGSCCAPGPTPVQKFSFRRPAGRWGQRAGARRAIMELPDFR
jgi:hypothetical protein